MSKRKNQQREILREYVRETILFEEEGYGSMMDASAGASPYGMHFASGNQLYNTFVKPFTDVFNTVVGKTKELSVKAQNLVKVTFEAIIASAMPWYRDHISNIFAKEKQEIDKLRNQYSEVYNATWKSLNSNDAAMLAFFCYPEAALTGGLAKKAPRVALGLLNTLSGGRFDNVVSKYNETYKRQSNLLGEADVQRDESKLINFVTSDKALSVALNSQKAKQLRSTSRNIVTKTLKDIQQSTQAIASAKSYEDLQNKLGAKIKGVNELDKLQPAEKIKVETESLKVLKKASIEFVVENLTKHVSSVVEAGIPAESWYVKEYQKLISGVKQYL